MENKQEVAWYVTIYSMGILRTYNFKSNDDRDWMYQFLLDRVLRNQSTQINDCKEKEVMLLSPTMTIIKGEMPIDLSLGDEEDKFQLIKFHKKDELILSAMGVKY